MTHVTDLIPEAEPLILWNEASRKWQDRSNDFYCSDQRGTWRVTARRGFEDGRGDIDFPNEIEAMAFFVNYLSARRMRKADEAIERMRAKAA